MIDTTHCPPDEVVSRIMAMLTPEPPRLAPRPRCLLSPRRLLPSADRDSSTEIAVAVVGPTSMIVTGHEAVSAAVAAAAGLVETRLEALDPEPVAGHPDTASWAETAVTAERVFEWERRHGFRFASLPPWVKRTG